MTCCPVRVQFSTGSDDGFGRVWADYGDARIGMIVKNGRGEDKTLGRESMIHSGFDGEFGGGVRGNRKTGQLWYERNGGRDEVRNFSGDV